MRKTVAAGVFKLSYLSHGPFLICQSEIIVPRLLAAVYRNGKILRGVSSDLLIRAYLSVVYITRVVFEPNYATEGSHVEIQ